MTSDRQTGVVRRGWAWVESWIGFFARNHPIIFALIVIVPCAALAWGLVHALLLVFQIEHLMIGAVLLVLLWDGIERATGMRDVR